MSWVCGGETACHVCFSFSHHFVLEYDVIVYMMYSFRVRYLSSYLYPGIFLIPGYTYTLVSTGATYPSYVTLGQGIEVRTERTQHFGKVTRSVPNVPKT